MSGAGAQDAMSVFQLLMVVGRLVWRFRRPIVLVSCVGLIARFGFDQKGIWPLVYAIPIGIALEFLVAWIVKEAWGWKNGRPILAVYFTLSGAVLGACFSFPVLLLCAKLLVPSVVNTRAAAENIITVLGAVIGAIFWPWYQVFRNPRKASTKSGGSWDWSHGSARWADSADLAKAGLLQGRGLLLGRFNEPAGSKLLAWDAPGHLLTVAPTRTGKGIGAVIPNLLIWPGSVLVTDPKGENYAVTQRVRRSMGQRVFALDPFEVSGPSARFNPLDLLDPASLDVADEAAVLADMLLISSGDARAAFWEDNAKMIIQALILYAVCDCPADQRHLPYVRHLLMSGPEEWQEVLGKMRESSAVHGLLSRFGNSIAQMSEKSLQDVLSTAKASTGFLDSPRLAKMFATSDFDLADLKAGDLSIYLILPADKLDTYSRFLRLVIGSALQACIKAKSLSPYPALMLLDEFAQLGPMAPVKRAYTLMGGMGVKVWTFLQDLAQLEHLYKEGSQTFIANATVKQFFGVSDLKTAEEISKMLGDQTITIENFGNSKGQNEGLGMSGSGMSNNEGSSTGSNQGRSQTGRALLKPDEVMRLNKDHEIILVQSQRPIFADKLNYLTDPFFQGRFDHNPMHQTAASEPEPFHVGQVPCPYCKRLNLIGRPTCEGCGGALVLESEVKA